jgi:putative transposase
MKPQYYGSPATDKIIALDPGVRTFMTGYDQYGGVMEYGTNGDNCRLFRLAMTVDKLESRAHQLDGRSHQSRRNHKKAAQRLRDKIRNRVDDMHHRVANDLLQHNDVILIPSFNVKDMVCKKMQRRLLRRSTTRQMLHWAHYRFRQYLLHKVREYHGKRVIVVTEEYTSKTCGQCGHIHYKLGSAKHFQCPSCSFSFPRDWNGARNILIKYLTEECADRNNVTLQINLSRSSDARLTINRGLPKRAHGKID